MITPYGPFYLSAERYKLLPSVAHRLRFLELQLELLEDFRMRLQQVKASEASEPLNPCYCAILNTANHLLACLHDWSDNMVGVKTAIIVIYN